MADSDIAERDSAVETIADSLLPAGLDRLFVGAGARAPHIVWSPGRSDLQHPLIEAFSVACDAVAGQDGQVRADRVLPDLLDRFGDWMMVLDVLPGGEDFRYAHYGRGIADHFGRDMTGNLSADFGGHIGTFFTALYRAAFLRRERVLSEHEPPIQVFVRSWRRLIVPLIGADGTVVRFAAINVPDHELRAGLDIVPDPVFLVDEDRIVRYANPAARELFHTDPLRSPGCTLQSVTGISLAMEVPPLEMIGRRMVDDRVYLTVGGAISDRFLVTVSGALHRGQGFYVVLVRLAVP